VKAYEDFDVGVPDKVKDFDEAVKVIPGGRDPETTVNE
jgi:hypothetical protein